MRFHPFEVPQAAWDRRLADLRFRFSKWDLHVKGRGTVAKGALVLTRDEHRHLVAASERLYALATAEAERLSRAPDAALGLDPALERLAAHAPANGRVTRIDWFPTVEGWRASEMNDDVPGGYNDALGLPAVLHDLVAKDFEIPGDLPESLPELVAGGAQRVGLCYATAYAEDLQIVRLLEDLLAARGVDAVVASPAAFAWNDGAPTLAGERVERAYRFFPGEWFPLLANVHEWDAAARAGFPVVNPFRAAWTQSKAAFARMTDSAIPRTLPLDAATRAAAETDPARWVLKPAWGRMGEGVLLGGTVPVEEWRAALAGALHRKRPHALQERFHPTPLEIAPGETWTPCVGAYVIDGRFAGYYSRISRKPVVAYDAANVLTLVELL